MTEITKEYVLGAYQKLLSMINASDDGIDALVPIMERFHGAVGFATIFDAVLSNNPNNPKVMRLGEFMRWSADKIEPVCLALSEARGTA